MSHTTNMLELECQESQWHISRLPYPLKKKCHASHANTKHTCKAKVGKCKHGIPMPIYRGLKKKVCSSNHMPWDFWICTNDINLCVKGRKKWVLDWPNLHTIWPVKVGTNLTQKEVFVLASNSFQL